MPQITVLVVSDDPVLKGLLHDHLGAMGYRIACTKSNGRELGEALYSENPDLAIIDIVMPWMDGIELCLRLRQRSQIPTIMLTTWGAGRDKLRGLDLGADSYLTEPFAVTELVGWVQKSLSRHIGLERTVVRVGSD